MKKIYVLAVIVLLMLTACKKGSDSPTAPSGAPSINYGTLTLSGTGSNNTGTTFSPAKVEFNASGTYCKWETVSFPYSGGQLEFLEFTDVLGTHHLLILNFLSSGKMITWSKTSKANESGIGRNTSTVTFNNVTLPGETNTTTSLTLNGTLMFQ